MLGFLSSGAKEFQSSGPDTAKLRGPIHTERVRGTVKSPRAADRRRQLYRFKLTGVSMLDRYGGARHVNTCRPVTRVYAGFFVRRGASVIVDADHPRSDRISVFPESGRAQHRLKFVGQFITYSRKQAITVIEPTWNERMNQHCAGVDRERERATDDSELAKLVWRWTTNFLDMIVHGQWTIERYTEIIYRRLEDHGAAEESYRPSVAAGGFQAR